jgi:hypothetical protein
MGGNLTLGTSPENYCPVARKILRKGGNLGVSDVDFSMKNAVFKFLLLAMAYLSLNGCGKSSKDKELLDELKNYKQPPDTDVTKNPDYFFSSFAGTVWRTRTRTALVEIKLYTGKRVIWFSPPLVFDPADPNYMPIAGMHVATVLPAGARICIDRLMQDNGIGGQVWVIASLENETNCQTTNLYVSPTFLANNSFFRGPITLHRWGVDSNYLEAATNGP